MRRPAPRKLVQHVLVAGTAALLVAARLTPTPQQNGPVVKDAYALMTRPVASGVLSRTPLGALASRGDSTRAGGASLSTAAQTALDALRPDVATLSHPRALEDAFRSYFAYRAAHADAPGKPLLYFVDYGLSSTTPRGYVFDMEKLAVVDGPFMVAHGRGSRAGGDGVPTYFSNTFGSATTSLGLFVAQELYSFVGHASGRRYSSIGLRLQGVSGRFNDKARSRGVVAHGAPYVTASRAGRSEGCPAVDPERAERLLPKLANGALVFLFAPDERWMANDPWLAGNAG